MRRTTEEKAEIEMIITPGTDRSDLHHDRAEGRNGREGQVDTIIITVKARHIRNMELGIKKYELRKTRPAKCKPYRVVICQSGSGGEVVAEFVSRVFSELSGVDEMKLAKLACITRDEVRGYRQKGNGQLFGWRVEDFKSLKGQELHVTDFGIDRPPQSWCYGKDRGGQASSPRLTGEGREK